MDNFAPVYSSLTLPVPAGTYCIRDGLLYRANTMIASGEAWTAAHWTRVNVGGDVGDMKSAADYRMGVLTEETVNINTVVNGRFRVDNAGVIKNTAGNYWGMKTPLPVLPSTGYTWNVFDHGATKNISYKAAWYDAQGAFLSYEDFSRAYTSPSVAAT